MFKESLAAIEAFHLDEMVTPRPRRFPKRYIYICYTQYSMKFEIILSFSYGGDNFEIQSEQTVEEFFKSKYYQAMDEAINQLGDRFDAAKPGLQSFFSLKKTLITGDINEDEVNI